MTRFCTKCGASVADDALFCDACGNPMRKPAAATAVTSGAETTLPVAKAPRFSGRALAIAGGVAATVVVAAGGIAWWMAPESASEASFARAVDEYYAAHAEVNERLLCLNDLPYGKEQIRVADYDSTTRRWMDALSKAGVYAAPTSETVGSFIPQTQIVYQLTEDGKKSVRNNKLCLGSKVAATKVEGFDRVLNHDGKREAMANAIVNIADETPWLAKSPDRSVILEKTNRQNMRVELPVSIVDGKWKVVDAPAPNRARPGIAFGSGRAEPPAKSGGIFDSIKKLLSFGNTNPLIGKWRDASGMASMEFTDEGMVDKGVTVKASYEVNGDEVTVRPEAADGVGMVFKVRDGNTISMDIGFAVLTLKRVN